MTTSWTLQGTQFGTLLATGVFIPFATLPQEQLLSWGWRVPFWLSAVVVVTAYIIRRKLEEPPAFREANETVVHKTPLAATFRHHKTAVLRIAAAAMINTVSMVFTVWSISYATNGIGRDRATMLWVTVVTNFVALFAIPLAAMVSD